MRASMRSLVGIACLACLAAAAEAGGQGGEGAAGGRAVMTYYGRASVKIKTPDGMVIYVDPYQGDYSEPADLILVTHGHSDHNAVAKVARKDGCVVAAPAGAAPAWVGAGKPGIVAREGTEFDAAGIHVRAVPAYNRNHDRAGSVGYVLDLGGLLVYHAGDSSRVPEMVALAPLRIDYALLCADGFYNMGPAEAADSARDLGARKAIPIHTSPNGLHDRKNAEAFASAFPAAVLVGVGESVVLSP